MYNGNYFDNKEKIFAEMKEYIQKKKDYENLNTRLLEIASSGDTSQIMPICTQMRDILPTEYITRMSSLNFEIWYPCIKDAVKTPESDFFPFIYDKDHKLPDEEANKIAADIIDFAAYKKLDKVFLKASTDARKFDWKNTCFADLSNKSELEKKDTLAERIQLFSEMGKNELFPNGIAARQVIDTSYSPVAWFDGYMPIVKECRFVVVDDKPVGYMPYWSKISLQDYYYKAFAKHYENGDSIRWNEIKNVNYPKIVVGFNKYSKKEEIHLLSETQKAAEALKRTGSANWAIDWLMDSNKEWHCIDIQPLGMSYLSTEFRYLDKKPENCDIDEQICSCFHIYGNKKNNPYIQKYKNIINGRYK